MPVPTSVTTPTPNPEVFSSSAYRSLAEQGAGTENLRPVATQHWLLYVRAFYQQSWIFDLIQGAALDQLPSAPPEPQKAHDFIAVQHCQDMVWYPDIIKRPLFQLEIQEP